MKNISLFIENFSQSESQLVQTFIDVLLLKYSKYYFVEKDLKFELTAPQFSVFWMIILEMWATKSWFIVRFVVEKSSYSTEISSYSVKMKDLLRTLKHWKSIS